MPEQIILGTYGSDIVKMLNILYNFGGKYRIRQFVAAGGMSGSVSETVI